jgi:hypothetical protein
MDRKPRAKNGRFRGEKGVPEDGPVREGFPESTDVDIMMLVPPKRAKYTERRA